jgi:(5-formylfuran-3-yl)methyl phosphate synthase
MVDTADKRAGSLFDVTSMDELRRFIDAVRGAGKLVGLVGALRVAHQPLLRALAPDFAGFRTAVCVADRRSALDPQRLRELRTRMNGQAVLAAG